MRRYGKSNRSKERQRWQKDLSDYWQQRPIESCEVRLTGCLGAFGLSPAHSKKRRFIKTRADYFEVCAACQSCHRQLDEVMTHDEMENKVREIISNRQTEI